MSAVVAFHIPPHVRRADEAHRDRVLERLPVHLAKHVFRQWDQLYQSKGNQAANLYITHISELVEKIDFELATNDKRLIEAADFFARRCRRLLESVGDIEQAFLRMVYLVDKEGIAAPDPEKCGLVGAVLRMTEPRWWRRQLRKLHYRGLEQLEREVNAVNVHCDIYASTDTVNRRQAQKARNRRLLEGLLAINEEGKEYTLAELSDLNVSNPAIRRAELMTRIRGFEELAEEWGRTPLFITLTAPARMHRALRKGGIENPKWDGSTPRDVQEYLQHVWEACRKGFNRRNIELFGFRVVEPHHDGTPHWHFLLFAKPDEVDQIAAIMRRHALAVDPNEPGAHKHRFTIKRITKRGATGGAAAYIAKYIAKNIDGYGVDVDAYGHVAATSAPRIEAWASTWGVRQFQQIGGPSVTVWRELRRIRHELDDPIMEAARKAADAGDWKAYCKVNWHRIICPLMEEKEAAGMYGDTVKRVIGVASGLLEQITRVHEWDIRPVVGVSGQPDMEVKPVKGWRLVPEQTERLQKTSAAHAAPWSCVNNCRTPTDQQENQELNHDYEGEIMALIEKRRRGETAPAPMPPAGGLSIAARYQQQALIVKEMERQILRRYYYTDPDYADWSDEEFLEHFEMMPEGREYAAARQRLNRLKYEMAQEVNGYDRKHA